MPRICRSSASTRRWKRRAEITCDRAGLLCAKDVSVAKRSLAKLALGSTKLYDELNLTPLMDLAWTLLIVFVIMATATVQGIAVNLPKAGAAPSMGKPKTKAVTITSDGRIYLDTALVSLVELEMRLRAEGKAWSTATADELDALWQSIKSGS